MPRRASESTLVPISLNLVPYPYGFLPLERIFVGHPSMLARKEAMDEYAGFLGLGMGDVEAAAGRGGAWQVDVAEMEGSLELAKS